MFLEPPLSEVRALGDCPARLMIAPSLRRYISLGTLHLKTQEDDTKNKLKQEFFSNYRRFDFNPVDWKWWEGLLSVGLLLYFHVINVGQQESRTPAGTWLFLPRAPTAFLCVALSPPSSVLRPPPRRHHATGQHAHLHRPHVINMRRATSEY